MKRIVWDQPERVMQFVAARTGGEAYCDYAALGLEQDGELVAGTVYNHRAHSNIWTHIAVDGGLAPAFICAGFRYPFIQLGCQSIAGAIRADNATSLALADRLGYMRRGLLPGACEDGADLIIVGMRKSECRYLTGKYHDALLAHLRRA